jgi:hypothetical protein
MNYKKIYNQLIDRAQSENRQKGSGVYFERHHIIPRCLGGTNDKINLVLLTAREHYVAHKLLCEIYPNNSKLHYALWRMMNYQSSKHERDYIVSSKEYSRRKQIHSELIRELGKQNNGKINVISEETRNKMKLAKLGKPRSKETKEKISNTLTGYKQTPETIELRRSKLKGMPGYWKGKQRSDETKEKIRQTLLNKNK